MMSFICDLYRLFLLWFGPVQMRKNSTYTEFSIGEYTYGRPKVTRYPNEKAALRIGRFCSIAGGVRIILGGNHHTDWVSTYPFSQFLPGAEKFPQSSFSKGDIVIGHDVWIGTGVTIVSGANIGSGAVIAAGSVVASDIPPYSIVGGVPAKLIKYRFGKEQIAALQKIAWWDWPEDKLRDALPLMLSTDIDGFIRRYYHE